MRWFDEVRWNEEESKKMVIPGPIFQDLGDSQKILVHWLAYITDQQRPYRDVWMKGGPIFAEIVSNYTEGISPSLSLLRNFTIRGELNNNIDTFWSKIQYVNGEKIEYTSRYGMHILSIARTLYLLEFFKRGIFQYLAQHWDFIDSAKEESIGDNRVSRIAFLLYLLTYKDIRRGLLSYHRDEKEIRTNVKGYAKRLKGLSDDKKELTVEFEKWSNGSRYHKRLWAALRDYLKSQSPFYQHFIGALENLGSEKFKNFVKREQAEILESLELPGDIWNLVFFQKTFEGNIKSPKDLRMQYENLRVSYNTGTRFYPEQFDVSFSFSPNMCDKMMEEYCPFRADSKIREFCLYSIGMPTKRQFCPVAMITCGFTYYCEPEGCPIKDGIITDLCPGCSAKIESVK